jgi:hypothetical protein
MPTPKDTIAEMLAAIGLDLSTAPPAGTPEFNDWLTAHVRDPKVRARAANVFASRPEMQHDVERAQEILETRAMRLLERPDFEPLLLSMREVAPVLDSMNRRTNKLHQLLALEKPRRLEMEEQMKTVWHELIFDWLPLLLHPVRRADLIKDLQEYAHQQNDPEAAESAYTAILILKHAPADGNNRFMFGYVMQSIRSTLEELSHWKLAEE